MSLFKAFEASSPQVEVDGRTVMAVINGMLVRSVARELMEAENLGDASEARWVPQQAWLNVYRRIQDTLGPDTLYAIGRRIPYSAEFPDKMMFDVPSALASIDVAYHDAHRGGEIGCYRFVEVSTDHLQIHCDNPYPNAFDLGIVTSLVERFRGRHQYTVTSSEESAGGRWEHACTFDVRRAD